MFLRQSPSADLSDTGSFVQTPEKPINRKDTNILPIRGNNRNRMMGPEIDEQSPQLLPYQHRKKLSQKEEVMTPDVVQHNNMIEQQLPPPPMDQSPGVGESSKRPPLPGANRGIGGGIEQQQLGAAPPPPPPMPMSNTMSSPPPSASKYKVAVIPPFRGGLEGGGQSHERNSSMEEDESIEQQRKQGGSGGRIKKMRKVKSAQSSSSSSRKNRKNKRGTNSGNGNNNNPNQSSKATPDNNGDKFRPPRHEVIDPTPPPPLPQSPRQGGYHVRVSSQSSISSLESKAATDAEGQQQQQQQQRTPHPNTSEYWYYQQKQLQQQYNARQQNQQQQQQARGNFNVNFNAVLGPEVASFLHGEEIASAVERRQQGAMPSHPNSQQYGGPPPPQQQQWNDPRQQYRGHQQWVQGQHPGVYGQSLGHLIPNNHPLPPQQQPHGYPGYHPEPQAPPLTYQHPNMHFDKRQHRERLPSVSEDDFDEMLEDDKQNREGDRNRQQPQHQQQWNQQQQQYSRQYNNPQQQQWNQQQYPPRQQQGHERKHSRKGSRRQRSRGGSNGGGGFLGNDGPPPNEKSSLLSATGIQTYESRDGRGGGGVRDYNVNNNPGVWGGQQQRHPQAYNTPREQQTNTSRGGGGATNSSKKKKSKRRRREKEKRRFAYPSDSSDEETSGNRRSTTKSKRRGGGGGRRSQRKKRSQATGGGGGTPSIDHSSMSETYSESLMSTSYADRSERVRAKGPLQQLLISSKLLICNLPLSSAAISFSIVLLGIVWLKWTEEILPSCKEVNFHSSQCTYPEFPGCYFCDEYNPYYRLATQFHTVCSLTAGISVLLFFVKAILCWRVFMDEMSSPTTASPSGLIFMTMALGFVGKDWGDLGMILVFIASLLHLVLVVWFIYMSLAYQTMPDPSWFANTIGIGLCAVKIWFYYPLSGHFLIAITLMLTFLYYPIR